MLFQTAHQVCRSNHACNSMGLADNTSSHTANTPSLEEDVHRERLQRIWALGVRPLRSVRKLQLDCEVLGTWQQTLQWAFPGVPFLPGARNLPFLVPKHTTNSACTLLCRETVTQFRRPLGAVPPSARRHPKAAMEAAWLCPVGAFAATCASFAHVPRRLTQHGE